MAPTMERPADMQGKPPEITTTADILSRMRQGVEYTFTIRLRGMEIPMRVLSITEANAVRKEGMAEGAKRHWDQTEINLHIQRATLVLGSKISSNSAPTISHKLLEEVSLDETQYLYNEYLNGVERVNPSVEAVGDEEFRGLVDALKKKSIQSKDLSIRQLRAMCTAFVDLIQRLEAQSLQQDSSHGGQPAE